jgi:hypothetical protein
VEVVHPSGSRHQACFGELFGHRDDISGLSMGIQVQNGVKNNFVLGEIKIPPSHYLDYVSNRVLAQKHASKGALFGQHIVGRSPISTISPIRRGVWNDTELSYRHNAPPFLAADTE